MFLVTVSQSEPSGLGATDPQAAGGRGPRARRAPTAHGHMLCAADPSVRVLALRVAFYWGREDVDASLNALVSVAVD